MPPLPPPSAVVGRDDELAVLTGLLREVSRGRGCSLLIEGEPGIGKSTLVRSVAARAPEVGCQTFWGAGDELGQGLPLLPFLDALQVREPSANPRRTAIVRLLRGEIVADRGADMPAALAEQLLALLVEQCAVRPVMLVVDDLQWADQASVALWGRMARLTAQVPLLLIGMMRPVPLREDLLALRRIVGDAGRLRLTGLTEAAVTDLVAALAGGKPDGDLLELAAGAAGSPLYLTELVAALVRGSRLTVTEAGIAELASGSAPDSLSAAIADRLGFVARPVREVLRAAALLGVDFTVHDLAVVLNRGVPNLIPAVEEACAAGVLAASGAGLGFRHPLIRAALYEEMPGPVRAAWHAAAGRALSEAGAPPDRVARQLLRAVDGPGDTPEPMDEWMLNWLFRSADHLVSHAPGVAAELLARAVGSSPADPARHGWLASRLANALYRIGDRTGAERVVHRSLERTADPDVLVDMHWTLAQCHVLAGMSAESLATLDRALASPGLLTPHRARLLVMTARIHGHLGEFDNANRVAADALAAATEAADKWAMSWSLFVMAGTELMQGQVTEALRLYDRALTVTQADPALTDLRLLVQINMAVTLGSLDEHDKALAAAEQARHLADRVGTAIRLAQAHSALGQLLFQTGRWDEALAEVAVLPETLKEPAAACCDLGIAAIIKFHRGETAAARRYLECSMSQATRLGQRLIGPLVLARSLDREHHGAPPEALTALTDAVGRDTKELDEFGGLLLASAVHLATRTGDLRTARSLAARAEELAAGTQIPHRQANVLYCRGLLDHDAALLLAAAQYYDAAGRPLPKAMALDAAASEFIEAGDREQARMAFTEAVEVYGALGAAADVARLKAAFRVHGIRRGPREAHRRARSGWDSLTSTEITVASFVQEGLSNPQIAARLQLSRRTIATHVSHILKKLDVQSRTDIARESALRAMASR
jgi:DNA-binding CsgD family transcriptional regulator